MENFYNENYKEYEAFTDSDFINSKIWKISYDINQDLVYIFVAKIRHIKGKKLTKYFVEHKNLTSTKLM